MENFRFPGLQEKRHCVKIVVFSAFSSIDVTGLAGSGAAQGEE
jgi:hypothetical protein